MITTRRVTSIDLRSAGSAERGHHKVSERTSIDGADTPTRLLED